MTRSADTDARIEHVCDLMRSFKFRRGKTAEELSQQWGLGLHRVHEITAEASRRVRAEVTDPERVRPEVCASLAAIMVECRESPSPKARRDAIEAAKAWALISGAQAPLKTRVELERVDAMPEGELAELANRLALEIQRRARQGKELTGEVVENAPLLPPGDTETR